MQPLRNLRAPCRKIQLDQLEPGMQCDCRLFRFCRFAVFHSNARFFVLPSVINGRAAAGLEPYLWPMSQDLPGGGEIAGHETN